MQTFLPYPDFQRSLDCLDRQRLGKQRVEAWQIIQRISGWVVDNYSNHAACRMWKGYSCALGHYYNAALAEWEKRGYSNIKLKPVSCLLSLEQCSKPAWLGCPAFHLSHKRLLTWKAPLHYAFPRVQVPPEYPDKIWPIALDGSWHPAVQKWILKKSEQKS